MQFDLLQLHQTGPGSAVYVAMLLATTWNYFRLLHTLLDKRGQLSASVNKFWSTLVVCCSRTVWPKPFFFAPGELPPPSAAKPSSGFGSFGLGQALSSAAAVWQPLHSKSLARASAIAQGLAPLQQLLPLLIPEEIQVMGVLLHLLPLKLQVKLVICLL